jgi:2-polyprenyl-6-methoxyphenol hydroxylase-like FAD-dependent oxidoreductase
MHGVIRMKHGEGEDTDRPEIDRRDLRVLLLNSVPQDKIRWGVKAERVQKQDDGTMSVCFVDGNTESGFRLVVGADGARSKARSLVSSSSFRSSYYVKMNAHGYIGHIHYNQIRRQVLHH